MTDGKPTEKEHKERPTIATHIPSSRLLLVKIDNNKPDDHDYDLGRSHLGELANRYNETNEPE